MLLALWRPWRVSWTRGELLIVARYGVVIGLMNLCFYMSLKTLPLGTAIAIEFLGPLSVALAASRRPRHFLMVGLAVAGLSLLLPIRRGAGTLDITGVCYALGAAAFWALYIIFGRQAGRLHGGHAVALGMTTAALIVVPIGAVVAGAALLAPHTLLVGLVVALLSSAIPYSLEMVALKHIPPRSFGILLGLEPAVGALAGVVLLSERLPPVQWLAIGLVVLASAMTVQARTDTLQTPLPN
jgi:inner membrane transporter RhtA